jgi:hypothetical protein
MTKLRASKKASGWLQLVKAVAKKNKGKPFPEILKIAKAEWAKSKPKK